MPLDRNGRRWTEAEDIQLATWCIRLGGRARSRDMDRAIASQLGRTATAVRVRRQYLAGLLSQPVRRRESQQARDTLRLREAGHSYGQIAAQLGTTRGTVAGLLRDLRVRASKEGHAAKTCGFTAHLT